MTTPVQTRWETDVFPTCTVHYAHPENSRGWSPRNLFSVMTPLRDPQRPLLFKVTEHFSAWLVLTSGLSLEAEIMWPFLFFQ